MAASGFFRYEFRTTDTTVAQAFYTDVLGSQLWGSDVCIAPLPERAVARGGSPHWLGHIGISDAEGTAGRVVAMGGQQLGPAHRGADGSFRAILRDPFGALMAVSSETEGRRRAPVGWHVHHSQDHDRTFAFYAELFGWTATEATDLGSLGTHKMFAWDESGRTVGSMTNAARLPHIHPQWLFCFRVPDIEGSLARVLAGGGKALEPAQTSGGDIVAPCDDPQGAAFALYQFAA